MAYTIANLETKLQTLVRDSDESFWAAGEYTEVLTEAIEDPALISYAEDSTLTAATSTQEYTIPATIDKVVDVYITSDSAKYRINPENWEQINTTLRFQYFPPAAGTMTLLGIKKLASTDNIPNEFANFVLYKAAAKLYEILQHKYMTGFLINDVSLAEIMAAVNMFETRSDKERSKMGRVTNRRGYKI